MTPLKAACHVLQRAVCAHILSQAADGLRCTAARPTADIWASCGHGRHQLLSRGPCELAASIGCSHTWECRHPYYFLFSVMRRMPRWLEISFVRTRRIRQKACGHPALLSFIASYMGPFL